jgi:hypothetical protein
MKLAREPVLALRVARGQAEQQAAIESWLQERQSDATVASRLAVIAEGAFFELTVPPNVTLERLAPGCVCCVGLLPMQVTLTRMLRTVRPHSVLLLVSNAAHLERVRSLLAGDQFGVSLEGKT